ncbi:hypothetical protein [Halomonas denitrificans]|nr:hypothetical protein [Halomonas denitrificans]
MTGARVLQILGLILLLLGGAAIALQLGGGGSPVAWLGAIGPIVMGIALLIIARGLERES